MRTDLKFLMQFHGLTGEGEFCGLGGLRHATVQRVQILLLRGGQIAEFTFGGFLSGDVDGNFGAKRIGSRDVGGGQSRGNFCMVFGGGDDESSVVRENGGRKVRAMIHVSSKLRVAG